MQFQLPANLREQVAVYDPALKAMIQAQKRANSSSKKKSSAPLGLPDSLLPEEVATKEEQIAIAKEINSKPAVDRWHFVSNDSHCYVVYHHESMWIAAWIDKSFDDLSSKESPYVYGLTVAYKAAPSTTSKVRQIRTAGDWQRVFNVDEEMKEVRFGRVQFLIRSKTFTLDDIQNGDDRAGWLGNLNSWGASSREKNHAIRQFQTELGARIPRWDNGNLFDRIADKHKSVSRAIGDRRLQSPYEPGDLTVETLKKWLPENCHWPAISNTPYFRREMQTVCDKVNALFHDKAIIDLDEVKKPYKLFRQQTELATNLLDIYGETASVDHVQKMYEIGKNVTACYLRRQASAWIRANVPITSYVGWHEKHLKTQIALWEENTEARNRSVRRSGTGEPEARFHELRDTFDMIESLWTSQTYYLSCEEREAKSIELEPPSRWRLSEFHDHVSSKLWLYNNKNEDLPQDLFPTPIKIEHLDRRWTFFQPKDIHQLGQWGQAVRNCVGNASGYREGVKKRSHFIILAMIDQRPRFTVQLKVRNGVLEVDQIADVDNRRLDDTDRASYELTFSMALKVRENQLADTAEVQP